jgi:hypothetical protein
MHQRAWLPAADIATAVMGARGAAMDDAAFKAIITEGALGVLRGLAQRGDVVKSGTSRNVQWVIASVINTS